MTSVIFGGSSGIGHSIVRDLLKNGHSDIVNIDITPSDIASRNILGAQKESPVIDQYINYLETNF